MRSARPLLVSPRESRRCGERVLAAPFGRYLDRDPNTAGSLTHKEAGLCVEIAQVSDEIPRQEIAPTHARPPAYIRM